MKLQHRFLIWLLPVLAGLYLTSQVVLGLLNGRSLQTLEEKTFEAMDAAAVQNAQSLEAANVNSILDWMVEGDMDRVEAVMRQQREVEGVVEFSLFAGTDEILYSSHEENLGRPVPAEVASQLQSTRESIVQHGDGYIEIYRPMLGEQRCNECHAYSEGEIAGTTLLRLSTDAMDRAHATWTGSMNDLKGQRTLLSLSSAGILILVLGLVTYFTTERMICRPFRNLAIRLSRQATQLRRTSEDSANTSANIAEGSTQSAAALQQAHASAEQISGTTRANAEAALRAQSLGTEARSAADQGTHDMDEMIRAMSEIETGSSEIASIIKTIDEIAFQTNMLALNAAVEAARAGEAGQGFAVVAEEVRNLAQRAAKAAQETAQRIETSLQRTRHGATLNAKVAGSLTEIAEKTREFDHLVKEVANASQEQSKGIEQLSVGLSQLDQVTQTNAAHASEGAESASMQERQSRELSEVVVALEHLVFGNRGNAIEPTPAKPSPPQGATARISSAVRKGQSRSRSGMLVG